MPSLNKTFLIGNLIRDPEMSHGAQGVPKADMRLAINESFRDGKTGKSEKRILYVDIIAWDKPADGQLRLTLLHAPPAGYFPSPSYTPAR